MRRATPHTPNRRPPQYRLTDASLWFRQRLMNSAVLLPYSYRSAPRATTYTHHHLVGALPRQPLLLLLLHAVRHLLLLLLAEHVPAVVAQAVL